MLSGKSSPSNQRRRSLRSPQSFIGDSLYGSDSNGDLNTVLGLHGYTGPGLDHPRKYINGPLRDAYMRTSLRPLDQEYMMSCRTIGATPNSHVVSNLTYNGVAVTHEEVLGGSVISFRDTYLGERGFIALLPLLDRNNRWVDLDVSNNGLRNEAVLHLVDLLLRPQHAGREIRIDLSRNPISEAAGKALLELVDVHPRIEYIDVSHTKIPRRTIAKLKEKLEIANERRKLWRNTPSPEDLNQETAQNDESEGLEDSATGDGEAETAADGKEAVDPPAQ